MRREDSDGPIPNGPRARRVKNFAGGPVPLLCAVLLPIAAVTLVAPGQAAATPAPRTALSVSFSWQQVLPDAGSPVAEGSPSVATLDGGGPSVVVGDRAGGVYAFHLSDGSPVAGWPAHLRGPVDSTPSVASDGSGTDDVFVSAGNAADPASGGYVGLDNRGNQIWSSGAPDPNGPHGVQASMAVGQLEGSTAVVAPSLGQEEYALGAASGARLPGWPFFTADSGFTTPSLADLYGNGQTEIVEGGDSTAGLANGQTYSNGGHLRVLGAGGNLICSHDTNQTVDSSTAVGNFLAGGQAGIAFGTGSYYPGASDSNTLFASDSHCNIVWRDNLGGNTVSSPAIGDLNGDGNVEVLEGADTGSSGLVYALNGANGAVLPGWPQATPGRIIGGITTADLTGGGYNDVLVPTTDGLVIYDGRSAQPIVILGAGAVALQNSAAVTIDPDGLIGITIAGYDASNAGVVQHFEIAGSAGHSLGKRAWPMFHQNPQLTGWLNQSAPGHLNAPIVGIAATADGRGYWNVATDGGLFDFGDAGFSGSMGGHPLNRPVVGMAPTHDGRGYWEVASDGGLFAFGDAHFYGSTGSLTLNRPVVGMTPTPDGRGYWLVASDGGLFAFGDARLLRLDRVADPQQTGGRDGADSGRPRVLAGGLRRRAVRVRRRPLLRLDGWTAPQPVDRGDGFQRRPRLLAGGVRRGSVQLRDGTVLGIDGQPLAGPAGGRHGADAAWRGVLDGGGRRRHVRLPRRVLRLAPATLRRLRRRGRLRAIRPGRVAVLTAGLVLAASAAGAVVRPSAASAFPSTTVTVTGHGWGHGHGMGQWGALGYALAGTNWQQIVDHYYAGSTIAELSSGADATAVRVVLTENDGDSVIVTSSSSFSVDGASYAAGQAVQMLPVPGGWDISAGPGCGGGWTPVSTGVSNPTATGGTATLQLCQAGGNLSVHGSIEALYNSAGQARTVNILPLETYVADVVPSESPAGWGTLGSTGPGGQPWGFQELEAQAVAVRSYVMAGLGSYGGYADICDLSCQSYRGTTNESPLTNLAAQATAGSVMETNGVVQSTQYSASTGGYTNPGAFAGVPDDGDAVCVPGACNPNHTWTASVPLSTIEATWPQLGTLESIEITGRNGLGDWGGRVTTMTLVGSSQNVPLTGDDFTSALGLRSDWFTVTSTLASPAAGIAVTPDGKGYWIDGAAGEVLGFGDAAVPGSLGGLPLAEPVVGMAAFPAGQGYWEVASDGGVFSFGSASFEGSTGAIRLNRPMVGMAPTPDGRGYWLVASDGGVFAFGDAHFYGSTGNLVLNKPVVGMAATSDGRGYWLVASDGGVFAFGDAHFHGSMGGQHLNRPVVGMTGAPGGTGYRLVASDGGIFSFGTAPFFGSTGNLVLARPIVGMADSTDGQGYWMVASDGGVFSYGDAHFYGSAAG